MSKERNNIADLRMLEVGLLTFSKGLQCYLRN